MASLVLNNCVQVRLIWQLNSVDWAVSVLTGIRNDPLTGVGQAQADTLATAVGTRCNNPTAMQGISTAVRISRIGLRDVNSPNNPEFIGTATNVAAGVNTGELLPLQVACCVTMRTAKAGASYRGRFYVSGYTEGVSTAGAMTSGVMSGAQALVTGLKQAMNDAGYTLAVGSRKRGAGEAVTTIQVRDNQWDTQRRRQRAGI